MSSNHAPVSMAAWERVGETADAQGRWLVRFSELESKRLSTGDRLNLQWEVLLFTLGRPVNFRMPLPPHVLLLKWQAWLRAGLGRLAAERVWEVELGRRVIRASTEATVRKRNIVCCGVRVTGMTSETPFANGHSTRSRALDGVSDSTAHADARLWLGAGKLTVQRAVRRQ